MWAFQYKHGDRPLEGYTIQRAAGRGGFGEVYYATSDSGREVALKVVQGYEQIELRGITQCMNLKSPHLVSIFDVKFNDLGRPFVIMEYVSGANLRQMIDESPAGLGTQKAAFFLREIAKGLQYLHDCGIVHRDLKPGNIFYENGLVKIGDYGLSKAISTSQHSGQTVTVGTVHYMAPEIGAGKYDRSIDIYAMGAVLYEMLTGVVPFVGASPTEVLMKHLSAEPDCSHIPEPFCTAIRKAMAKDPANRFQSIQEMVEAVFGAEHVQMSVSQFSTQDLSMVAGKVAAKVLAGGGGGAGSGSFSPSSLPGQPAPVDAKGGRIRSLIAQAGTGGVRVDIERDDSSTTDEDGEERVAIAGWTELGYDRLPIQARIVMAATTIIGVAICTALFGNWQSSRPSVDPVLVAILVTLSASSATTAMLLACRWLAQLVKDESPGMQRMSIAAPAAIAANLLALPLYFTEGGLAKVATFTVIAVAAPLLLIDVRSWLSPTRVHRVNLGQAIAVCGIGFVIALVFSGSPLIAIGVLSATALGTQIVSPWDPELKYRRDKSAAERYALGGLGIRTDRGESTPQRFAGAAPVPAMHASPPPIPVDVSLGSERMSRGSVEYPPVRRAVPFIWLGLFIVLVAVGIPFIVAADSTPMRSWTENHIVNGRNYSVQQAAMTGDAVAMLCVGVGSMILAVFAMGRAITKKFKGWWSYLLRPTIRTACILVIVSTGIVLGNAITSTSTQVVGTSFIVLSSLLLIFVTVIPTRWFDTQASSDRSEKPQPKPVAASSALSANDVSPRKRVWALILALIGFAGFGGLHRFYVGKVGTGVLWLITGGLFYFGTIIDVIMILSAEFCDSDNKKLVRWADEQLPSDKVAPIRDADVLGGFVRSFSSSMGGVHAARAKAVAMARTAGGGIVSAMAAFFLFAGSLTAFALAIDVPAAIDAGRPHPQVKQNLLQAFKELNLVSGAERSVIHSLKIEHALAPGSKQLRQESAVMRSRLDLTHGVDRAAAEIQEQFQGFDRELARAIVDATRNATRGGMPVRQAMEIKTAVTATLAMRDALKALEEARNSLAALERARNPDLESTDNAAANRSRVDEAETRLMKQMAVEPIERGAAVGAPTSPTRLVQPETGLTTLSTESARQATPDFNDESVATPLRLIGVLASGVFYLLGVTLLVFARRSHGAPHLLRGIVGVGSIIASMAVLHTSVSDSQFWERTAGASLSSTSGLAIEVIKSTPTILAGVALLFAIMLMGWPPRRENAKPSTDAGA